MAIYHFNVSHSSKGKGKSALAKSNYIDRQDRYEKRSEDLKFTKSGNIPDFANGDIKAFWRAADEEGRANSRTATEFRMALPRELTLEQQMKLVDAFIAKTIDTKETRHTFQYAIHNDNANNNPHVHLIFNNHKNTDGVKRSKEAYFRQAQGKNGKKPAEEYGAPTNREIIKRSAILELRSEWRRVANEALEACKIKASIDERTLKEQGNADEVVRLYFLGFCKPSIVFSCQGNLLRRAFSPLTTRLDGFNWFLRNISYLYGARERPKFKRF